VTFDSLKPLKRPLLAWKIVEIEDWNFLGSLDVAESYFLSEGLTCDADELVDAKEVTLLVCKLGFDQGY